MGLLQCHVAAVIMGLSCLPCAQPTQYGPSPNAIALQHSIDTSIAGGASSVAISAGDYYFGNASLLIQRASDFSLWAKDGPGTVQLWFCIGAGVLVDKSRDVLLDGLSIDYDPPAHYQGTVVQVTDDNSSDVIQAMVKTDAGFLDPEVFDEEFHMGVPGVQAGPAALVWNSSDGFGAFASASWPPIATANGHHVFNLSRAAMCKEIQSTTTDGSSCQGGSTAKLQLQDKITAHIRFGFTLHILNSTQVQTRNSAIHGAPGFAISEYDGHGGHSYINVSLGRRHVSPDAHTMCGISNPTGGRLCLGMIASNNDALHSSGCKYGPSFTGGELSYCLDDWVNIHSRAQVVTKQVDARHIIMIDPRLSIARSVLDDFPYGNAETLTNARPGDQMSFFTSGNLSNLGSARISSIHRTTWSHDTPTIEQAQQLLDSKYNRTIGLDAGMHCRRFGCSPRVWRVAFESDIPWREGESTGGVVASLDSWGASGAVVKDSHLHHGRYGIRWKSSDATITGNRISARYVEISPLEYYMEGPFELSNITVINNSFSECAAPAASFPGTACDPATHLPLGFWRPWVSWGGGCGGVCKAAAVGAVQLDPSACTNVTIKHNTVAR